MSFILEPNRVIISTNLALRAPRLTRLKKTQRGGLQIFSSRILGEGADLPGSHESYLQLVVKLLSGITLKLDTTAPVVDSPRNQAWELGDVEGTLFNIAHNSEEGTQCGILQSSEARTATADPLWWHEGTEGQSLRGMLASLWERVNVLLIWGQRCSLAHIHHHRQHQVVDHFQHHSCVTSLVKT